MVDREPLLDEVYAMKKSVFLLVMLAACWLLVVVGCTSPDDQAAATETSSSAATTADAMDYSMPAEGQVHTLRCGCAVEEVGQCGNYIEIEGQFVELVLPEEKTAELGEMPFCGKDDLMASVEGEMVDGKFVATTFEYVER
jgi:hypothetical protein